MDTIGKNELSLLWRNSVMRTQARWLFPEKLFVPDRLGASQHILSTAGYLSEVYVYYESGLLFTIPEGKEKLFETVVPDLQIGDAVRFSDRLAVYSEIGLPMTIGITFVDTHEKATVRLSDIIVVPDTQLTDSEYRDVVIVCHWLGLPETH